MSKPQRIIIIVLWLVAAVTFCVGTSKTAPHSASACKFGNVTTAIAVVPGRGQFTLADNMVGEWVVALQPMQGGANFYGLPRVVTVGLFAGDEYAGLLTVRGSGAVLRLWARGGKDMQPCAAGEIDAAIVESWIAQIAQGD
jgi:hypothetical protein